MFKIQKIWWVKTHWYFAVLCFFCVCLMGIQFLFDHSFLALFSLIINAIGFSVNLGWYERLTEELNHEI